MDALADRLLQGWRLPWSHPHRSVIGLGNYDVNVLMYALQEAGLKTKWVGMGVGMESVMGREVVGFLVNVVGKWRWPVLLRAVLEERRHWVAVVKGGDGVFYLVNSDKEEAEWIGSEGDAVGYLEGVREEGGHVLYVVRGED